MRIFFPIIVTLLLVVASCKKPGYNDLGGSSTISGVALLHDTYSSNAPYLPLKGISVYLRSMSDTTGYLNKVNTDNLGQFSFTNIDNSAQYRIDAAYDSGQVHYTGKLYYNAQNLTVAHLSDTLLLQIDTLLQNGIHVVVNDYLGGFATKASVWVFNSYSNFTQDTMAGSFTMLCDEYGVANRYGITAGNYYFRVKYRSGGIVLVDEQQKTINATGIVPVSLTVGPVPRTGFGNGVDILVKDQNQTPVSNASVYFYKDYDTYIQDSAHYQNSLFKLISGADGHATSYVINPATYFYRARKLIATNDTLSSRDFYSVTVATAVSTGGATVK
jgi:hypothetical protein